MQGVLTNADTTHASQSAIVPVWALAPSEHYKLMTKIDEAFPKPFRLMPLFCGLGCLA